MHQGEKDSDEVRNRFQADYDREEYGTEMQRLLHAQPQVKGVPVHLYGVKLDDDDSGGFLLHSLDADSQFHTRVVQAAQKDQNQRSEQQSAPSGYAASGSAQDGGHQEVRVIVHKVRPVDTLIGLAVQYGVPENKIKAFNHLDNDEIYYRKELLIPDPQTDFGVEYDESKGEEARRKLKVEYFKNTILKQEDRTDGVAAYYLSEAQWEHERAAKLYFDDCKWEEQNKGAIQ